MLDKCNGYTYTVYIQVKLLSMSLPSITEVKADRHDCVQRAIANDDYVALFRYADLFAKEGEDEAADYCLQQARQAHRNEWAYDEARDNDL